MVLYEVFIESKGENQSCHYKSLVVPYLSLHI